MVENKQYLHIKRGRTRDWARVPGNGSSQFVKIAAIYGFLKTSVCEHGRIQLGPMPSCMDNGGLGGARGTLGGDSCSCFVGITCHAVSGSKPLTSTSKTTTLRFRFPLDLEPLFLNGAAETRATYDRTARRCSALSGGLETEVLMNRTGSA